VMGWAAAIALALLALGSDAQAVCNFTEPLSGKQTQLGRHINDESLGDEFKRPTSELFCR